MEIGIKDIGHNKGKTLWICDYRRPDLSKKAIRSVTPTPVIVKHQEEIRENLKKNVYYSNYGFVKMGKNGETRTVIAPYDNTGFRSYTGEPLHVFDNKTDCFNLWVKLIGVVKDSWSESVYHSEIVKDEEIELLNKKVNLVKKQLGLV